MAPSSLLVALALSLSAYSHEFPNGHAHQHAARATVLAGGSVTLASVNPTAVPLTQIVSGAPAASTRAVPTPAVAGQVPSYMPNAPPLPNLSTIVPSNYPALDTPPPTDSPQVKAWIAEVAASGVSIPTFSPTNIGGCGNNSAAISDEKERCWWTCSGCDNAAIDVSACPDKNTWGLTYDDGPSAYTPDLLAYLAEKNLTSTLFVIGSRALSNPAILQAAYMAGHQIADHTWSHKYPLTTMSTEGIIAELGWARKVIKDITGVTPAYFRPPQGDIDNRVRAISVAMGMTPVLWTRVSTSVTFNTNDFDIAGGLATVETVLEDWQSILANVSTLNTGFIVLEHDLFQQSVEVATGYIMPDALAHVPAFKIEPVISCLGKPMSAAYIETNDNKTNPPLASGGSQVGTATASASASGSRTAGGAQSTTGAAAARMGSAASALFLGALVLSFGALLTL